MRSPEWGGKRIVAILVSVDVLWHLFEIVVGPLGNELALLISTGLELFPQPLAVEVAFQGLILFAAFYQVIPAIFRPTIDSEAVAKGFRVLSSFQSTLLALPLLVALRIPEMSFGAAVATVGVFVFTIQVFAYYHTHRGEDDIFTGETPTQALRSMLGVWFTRVRSGSTEHTVERSTRSSNRWRDAEFAAAGSIAAVPALYCLFLGILGALGVNTFPILESVIAIWLLGDWLDGRRDLGPRSRKVLRGSKDLEGRIYSHLNVLRSGREGLYGMLVIVLGFSISVRLLQMGFAPSQVAHFEALLTELWRLGVSGAPLQAFLVPLEQLSWTMIPVSVGLFNLWYWYRMLQRLSYSVDRDDGEVDHSGPKRLVRRPPMDVFAIGWLLFAFTQLSALFAVARWLTPTGGPDALVGEVFGIVVAFAYWPALLLLCVISLLSQLSPTRRLYGMQRIEAFPFFELSREMVPRDPPQLGIPPDDDSDEHMSESDVRIVSIEVAIAGYLGINALTLLLGGLRGGVLRSVPPTGNVRLEAASSIALLGWQPLLTYLYISIGLLLLSVSIEQLPIDQEGGRDRILTLSDRTLAGGFHAPVFREILWILFAEFCIAIVVIQLAFQAPLPLFVMLIFGPFALIAVTMFSFSVCAVVSRLYDVLAAGS